jgi:hypothetical protein
MSGKKLEIRNGIEVKPWRKTSPSFLSRLILFVLVFVLDTDFGKDYLMAVGTLDFFFAYVNPFTQTFAPWTARLPYRSQIVCTQNNQGTCRSWRTLASTYAKSLLRPHLFLSLV